MSKIQAFAVNEGDLSRYSRFTSSETPATGDGIKEAIKHARNVLENADQTTDATAGVSSRPKPQAQVPQPQPQRFTQRLAEALRDPRPAPKLSAMGIKGMEEAKQVLRLLRSGATSAEAMRIVERARTRTR